MSVPLPASPAGTRPFDAVLWDMDGLLVDSEPLWFDTEAEVMAALSGPEWTVADQAACLGGSVASTAAYLLRRSGSARPQAEVEATVVEAMRRRLAAGVPLLPGAGALLAQLHAAGVPCALVSSSLRPLVDAVLGVVGAHHFAVTVAGDEVTRLKPDPEPYRRAAAALGVPTGRCVVLEDSPTGVQAGESAGCRVVAVPSLVDASAAPLARIAPTPSRPVLTSLHGVDLDALEALLLTPSRSPAGR